MAVPTALARNRLRRIGRLPWIDGNRYLINPKRRRAVGAVENVIHPGLAAVHEELAHFVIVAIAGAVALVTPAVQLYVDEDRRHHIIHVPDVVMD